MDPSTTIDIVIVNYRGMEDTMGAVASVCPWRYGRIWVVDNSEDRHEAAALALALQQYPEAHLLVAPGNLGFGRGCNLAHAQSSAELLLLLNPDARIGSRDIELLAAAMEEDQRWGALSPNIYWDEQRRFLLPTPFPMTPAIRLAMALATRLPPWLVRLCARWRLARMRQRTARQYPFAVSFLAGAVLLVRREAVSEAGALFDPAFFMFFEDSDLSLRLRKKGYALGIVPAARAVHSYRHKAYKLAMMAESEKIFYSKHFAFLYRISQGLSRLDRLGRAMDWGAVVARHFGPLHSAEELSQCLGDSGVLAVGLSPLLEAFFFRPMGEEPAILSAEEWELLEPGRYVAVARQQGKGASVALQMFAFEKI